MPQKQLARSAGKFVKHVVPAAFKPIHSLWHEVIGFIFLASAGLATWWLLRHTSAWTPGRLILPIIFIVVTAVYGISSFLKARHISRS